MQRTASQPSFNPPAIVIGGVAYGDRSRIVRLLTEAHGVVPLWVPNASKSKALWHPMAVVEIVDLRQGKSGGLWTAREWKRSAPQLMYRREPARSAVGFFIAEVLSHSLEEGAPAPEVHHLACLAANWLDAASDIPWIHVKFMAEFVHALGLLPQEPPVSGWPLDISTGEYVRAELAPKTAVDAATVRGMREIVGMDFGEVHRLNWAREQRKALVLGAHRYVQAQLGKSRELKSYDVLEALFA
ncbi:MAG: DNA repair protein RecO C-terminal domain-containing protein [Bacteroidota bacterium]|nr:DNA repair protein RecO C-terminal domain-containing protein [Bacteroidota bacterium]